jgi:SPP1 gp7 family putative phage head morphogenesis protein
MAKKQPPHLVMAKQATITNKDPFKTKPMEEKISLLIEKTVSSWFDDTIKKIEEYLEKRELAEPPKLLKAIGITELETEDLKAKAYEYTKKGYLQGVQLGATELGQLNVDIAINLGNPMNKKALGELKEWNEQFIGEWSTDLQKDAFDIVYKGLESGKTIAQMTTELEERLKVGISEAKREISNKIIQAAREAEKQTFQDAGIELYRWITIVDNSTCEFCPEMAGNIYQLDPVGRGYVNFDTGAWISDDIAALGAPEEFINPDKPDGPPIHNWCRCTFQPVMTRDQYKGTVNTVVSEV